MQFVALVLALSILWVGFFALEMAITWVENNWGFPRPLGWLMRITTVIKFIVATIELCRGPRQPPQQKEEP